MRQLEIAGVKCHSFSSNSDVIAMLDFFLSNSIGTYSVAINAEKIIRCNEDPDFKRIVNDSLFQVPDGVAALFFLSKKNGIRSIKVDLPNLVLEYSNVNKLKLAVLGSNEENNSLAFSLIKTKFSQINLLGRLNGYSSFDTIVDFLNSCQPQIILMGLGSPKQEIFSSKLSAMFPNLLIINCGGAIDVLSGSVKRAPLVIQKFNIEWLYRLVSQPKRFKRQIKLFKILPIYLSKK